MPERHAGRRVLHGLCVVLIRLILLTLRAPFLVGSLVANACSGDAEGMLHATRTERSPRPTRPHRNGCATFAHIQSDTRKYRYPSLESETHRNALLVFMRIIA